MKPYKVLICILLTGIFISCKDDNPSIDDYPLNYEIPDIPVSSDIPVGAFVYNPFDAFNDEVIWNRITAPYELTTTVGDIGPYIMPAQGSYALRADTAGGYAYQQIVEWAKEAKIDFLITPAVREHANALYPANLNSGDMALCDMMAGRIDTFPVPNMGDLKYAIAVDINNFSTSTSPALSNNELIEHVAPYRITVEGVDTLLIREERLYSFIKRISDYFKDETYYHTNGRPVVVFINAERLYSENAKRLYDNMRDTIKANTGKDVYIIARQPNWTPSSRYEYFFLQGHVDAVTMYNMCHLEASWDRLALLSQFINENFKYNREYIANRFGIDFVPSVSPSFSHYVNNGDYSSPVVRKNPDEFRERCNVAKMNLGDNRMVLIESFNNWRYESQIEPTVVDYGYGYGTTYLDIVREEFKVKK
jgi:hypothetical protein